MKTKLESELDQSIGLYIGQQKQKNEKTNLESG